MSVSNNFIACNVGTVGKCHKNPGTRTPAKKGHEKEQSSGWRNDVELEIKDVVGVRRQLG